MPTIACPNCGKDNKVTAEICERCDYVFGTPLPAQPAEPEVEYQQVVIKDIEMEFGSMVIFMIKWVFAAIPAAIIIFLIYFIVAILIFEAF